MTTIARRVMIRYRRPKTYTQCYVVGVPGLEEISYCYDPTYAELFSAERAEELLAQYGNSWSDAQLVEAEA